MTQDELEALRYRREQEHRQSEDEYREDMAALERVFKMLNGGRPLPNAARAVRKPGNRTGKGALQKAIVAILPKLGVEFTVADVIAALPDAKPSSVSVALNKMVTRKQLTLEERGIGRRPSVYARPDK